MPNRSLTYPMIVRNPLLWKDFSPLISILFFFPPVCRQHVSRNTNNPADGHAGSADPNVHCGEAAGASDNPGMGTLDAAMCNSHV